MRKRKNENNKIVDDKLIRLSIASWFLFLMFFFENNIILKYRISTRFSRNKKKCVFFEITYRFSHVQNAFAWFRDIYIEKTFSTIFHEFTKKKNSQYDEIRIKWVCLSANEKNRFLTRCFDWSILKLICNKCYHVLK